MSRKLIPAFLILTGFFASACTAILVPDEDDDGVQRCDNSDECDATGDNRFEAVCVYGEDQDPASQKVCAVEYAKPTCIPENFPEDHPFRSAYEAALDELGAGYPGCPEPDDQGIGCGGSCTQGSKNDYDTCDDGDGLPAVAVNADSLGQDVLDQYCRYRFCNSDFVCDRGQATAICVPCDANKPFGEGGCGELYSGSNTKSSVYLAEDTDSGSCGSHDADGSQFGPVPQGE